MSLIQVSSNQQRLQNVSQGKQTFQKGSSFSNFFNNLLDVPADSEIALHSAQFRVQNRESFDLNGYSQEGNNYNVRMLYGENEGDYSGAERPPYPTHFPLLSYVPQKKYAEIQDFAKDLAKVLSLSSTPALQGAFDSNLTLTALGKKQINFDVVLNPGNSGDEALNPEFFVSEQCTAAVTGVVIKNAGTGNQAGQGATWTSEMNGIHNIGHIVFNTLNAPVSAFSAGVPYPRLPRSHTMACGIKRFTSGQDFQAVYGEPTLNPGIHFRNLNTTFGLNRECIGEYMFVIRGKTSATGSAKGTPCMDIVKFELNSNAVSEPVVIATGDPITNTNKNVPYSAQLDAGSAAWVDAAGINGTANQIIAPVGTASVALEIVLASNKVTFKVNNVVVQSGETPEAAMTNVEGPMNDDVFPLQPYGCLTGESDTMRALFTPVETGEQKKVTYLGKNYNDFDKYVGLGGLIPNAIYNLNAEFQETQPYYVRVAGLVAAKNPIVIPYDTVVGNFITNGDTTASGTLAIGLGDNPSTNILQVGPNQGAINPNVEHTVGSNKSVIVFTQPAAGVGNLTGHFVSDLGDAASPFLKGIYIRLRNLPNRSTFGSLNSADTDKLISVINKYDYTENQAGEKYPIYNYNENEKLYVALNNPALIQVNKLDFQLVDKSGKEVTDVDETTLVLHLRQRRI